jgi:hypothetical protein
MESLGFTGNGLAQIGFYLLTLILLSARLGKTWRRCMVAMQVCSSIFHRLKDE